MTRVVLAVASLLLGAWPASAERIANPIAVFNGLDKITGITTNFEIEIGKEMQFGGLIVKADVCYSRPVTEEPKTTAFVEADEVKPDKTRARIFSGWIFDHRRRGIGVAAAGGRRSPRPVDAAGSD
jgi:hypothetical protein